MLEGKTREIADVMGRFLPAIAYCAGALTGMPAWAADATEPLDIKPGLWEITLTVRTSGLPPIRANQRVPEGPRTTVKRSCLEERELHQPLLLTFGGVGQGCRQTLAKASRTGQEIRVECGKGAARGGGTIHIEAIDNEHAKVFSQWSAADGSRTLEMSSTAALRWLGTVCEAVFPGAPTAPAPQARPQVTPAIRASADPDYYYKLGREQARRSDLQGA